MTYATIIEVLTNKVKIKLNSDTEQSRIEYHYLTNYSPTVGDIVLVDSKLHIVIGKVVI